MHSLPPPARLPPTDPRYAPFGLPWLRGLNGPRVAFVTLMLLFLSTRRVAFFGIALGQSSVLDALAASLLTAPYELIRMMPLLILVTLADNLTVNSRLSARAAAMIGTTLAGVVIAVVLAGTCLLGPVHLLFGEECQSFPQLSEQRLVLLRSFAYDLFFAAPFVFLLHFLSRTRSAAAALRTEQAQRRDLERQMTEARLRTLRAQIEPHFLFNTLAHIQRLYQVRPADGRRMLRNLADYLRSALPQMRQGASTLGGEIALTRAYLDVQQIRMGRQLDYSIQVPTELQDAELPPMMLVTLVENAIKHGLGPKREGGHVQIDARRTDNGLEVAVDDDGVGLPVSSGTGVGLANTRARLATLFGAEGRLKITNRDAGGVSATLLLPYRRAGAVAE